MVEGITRISVKGFKSLAEECSLEIRPLTILAGANSSGKSSIMQPLLMMKQTLEASYDPGPLLLDGPNVRFTSADQFLSRSGGQNQGQFSVGLEIDGAISFYETFIRKAQEGMEIAEISYKVNSKTTILRPEMTRDVIISHQQERGLPKDYQNKKSEFLRGSLKIERDRCFLEQKLRGDIVLSFRDCNLRLNFFGSILSLVHLPALRGNPERNYKRTSVGPRFPGTFEIYAASIIHNWQSTKDPRLNYMGAALELLGLTWKVGSRQVDDVSFEVMVGRLIHQEGKDTNDLVSIADVGFGVSQTLPILVALLAAEPGQMVYIEQPEIHLHPRAQMAMAQILAEAANRGVRVVAETHSSLLLLGVQSLVAEGKLSPDKVKLHWFKRRPEDGITEVSSADLDKAGAFGDWPEDFSSAEMDADTRYIHAAETRLESN